MRRKTTVNLQSFARLINGVTRETDLPDNYEEEENINGNDRSEKSRGKHFDSVIGSRNSSFSDEDGNTADEKGMPREENFSRDVFLQDEENPPPCFV